MENRIRNLTIKERNAPAVTFPELISLKTADIPAEFDDEGLEVPELASEADGAGGGAGELLGADCIVFPVALHTGPRA